MRFKQTSLWLVQFLHALLSGLRRAATPFGSSARLSLFLATLLLVGESAPAAISVGGRVSVTQDGVHVRAGAGSTTIYGSQNTGAAGTVINGPTDAQISGSGTTYTWWSVNFDNGLNGWVASINLAEVAAAPVTLTLYVHNGSATGPVLAGASVSGSDGGGQGFNQTTNGSGYVTITGTPGS